MRIHKHNSMHKQYWHYEPWLRRFVNHLLTYYSCGKRVVICYSKTARTLFVSQIAHSDMHHPVSGINSLIHSVSLASHVLTHLLIHLSAHLYYHHHSHHPSPLHSFILGSKPTFSTNPSHLRFFLSTFMTTGLDRTYHAHRFIFSFTFYFFVCSVWWTKLATRQLFTAR